MDTTLMDRDGMEKWQLETAERLASIERSIKYIEAHMGQMPQSQQSAREIAKHDLRLTELEKFEAEIAKRIAWVSGAFAVVGASIPYLIDLVRHLWKA